MPDRGWEFVGHRGARKPATGREQLHRLVQTLPEESLERVLAFIVRELGGAALEIAPEDDEPLTGDDRAAIREGLAEYRQGLSVPVERVRRK
jgi:hypothetical protein